jgi:hypothetical protein
MKRTATVVLALVFLVLTTSSEARRRDGNAASVVIQGGPVPNEMSLFKSAHIATIPLLFIKMRTRYGLMFQHILRR